MSSEQSTVEALEKLLDLLSDKQPALGEALAQVESMLQQPLCVKEVREAGAAAAAVIEQLILPSLAQDPPRLQQARALQARFLQEIHEGEDLWLRGKDNVLSTTIQAIRDGMPVYVPPHAEEPLPRSLFDRMTAALSLLGESEKGLLEQVAGWQGDAATNWGAVAPLLEQIQAAGHKAAVAPWQRERRALRDTLLQIARGYEETLALLGRKDTDLSPLTDGERQTDSRMELRRLQTLLHSQVMALQKEARLLRAQQDEGRQRAEQLKERIDQLEATLAQARREQFLDPVTGIPDRFAFMAHLHRHLDRALHLGEKFSLLLLHFYELQPLIAGLDKSGGLLQGNPEKRLLMAIIQEVRPHLPDNAFLARLSTERMVILLPKLSVSAGEQLGTVIGQTLEEVVFQLDGKNVPLQVSCGCAAFQSGMNVAQMLETTDRLAAAAHSWREAGQMGAQRVRVC